MIHIRSAREFFEKTVHEKFVPSRARGVNILVQAHITGDDAGAWWIRVADQKMEVGEGLVQDPDLAFTITEADYVDLINGTLGAEKAFALGKIRLAGSIGAGMELRRLGFL